MCSRQLKSGQDTNSRYGSIATFCSKLHISRFQRAGCREGISKTSSSNQVHHGEAMLPTLDSRASDLPAVDFERVLNTEEAAALLQIHPKTLQRMARQRSVPAFRIGDLWRFRASALDEWLRSGVCSKRHSCR